MTTADKTKFRVSQVAIPDGRITVYKPDWPETNKGYSCCAGLDFAYGLQHGDADACVILDETGEQLATAHGRWGEAFGTILEPLFDWFNPFIVGERSATGLPILRKFYEDGRWVYYERDEGAKSRRETDKLGTPPTQKGLLLRWLQERIGPRDAAGKLLPCDLKLYDAELLEQLAKYQWRPRSRKAVLEETRDSGLMAGAPPGEHDDLVIGLMEANAGLRWLPRYTKPPEKTKPGTFAALGIGVFDQKPEKKGPWGR